MSQLTTKTARSIIYLCCIGGLLALNSVVVVLLWNRILREPSSTSPELSFLEGAGLTAFAYVVIFAVRYGLRSGPSPLSRPAPRATECDDARSERYAHLTPEERTAIKAELVRSCGCQENTAKQ